VRDSVCDVPLSYPEVRDRIYELCREHGLRPDWPGDQRTGRALFLYDSNQVVVARALVPIRPVDADRLNKLEYDLEHLFGKGWLQQ
jgi:hypothetical protein